MRRQNSIQAIILGVALAAAAGLAQAQTKTIDRGLYFGVSLGQSKAWDFQCEGFPECDQRSSSVRYFAGYQFARHWSAEFAYTDLGKFHVAAPGAFTDVKTRLGEATIVGSYPATGRWMVYGKGGAYYAKTTSDFSAAGTSGRLAENNWGVTWGLGTQYYMAGGLAFRVEAQRYMKVGQGDIGDSDIDAISIGLLYKF